jgi:hypothetical protein
MGEFFMILGNMFTSLSMAMAPMHASSWYIIEYMFLLNIFNSVDQKSSWFSHHYVPNLLPEAIF